MIMPIQVFLCIYLTKHKYSLHLTEGFKVWLQIIYRVLGHKLFKCFAKEHVLPLLDLFFKYPGLIDESKFNFIYNHQNGMIVIDRHTGIQLLQDFAISHFYSFPVCLPQSLLADCNE
jgi:hypothetical protein